MRVLVALLFAVLAATLQAAGPTLEYVAHAAFLVRSPGGTVVAIDPYNSNRWLGYSFPEHLEADAVLVSHPHYDHDADYNFGRRVPVVRSPGEYQVGDVTIRGIEGKHALHYGKEFGQRNTVWVVETGGVRIVHVGDNGPLSPAARDAVGSSDVLLAPVDDLEHILTFDEVAEMRRQLGAKVMIPMHYRIEALSERPASVGPIDRWLTTVEGVRRFGSYTLPLDPRNLPAGEIWVLPPSPAVRPWSARKEQAWRLRESVRGAEPERLIQVLRQARALAPDVMVFAVEAAEALRSLGRADEAAILLEDALATIARPDHEYAERARLELARAAAERGESEAARQHYRRLLDSTWRLDWREEAVRFLAR